MHEEQEVFDGVGLLSLDKNGYITYINRKLLRFIGYEKGEVLGKHHTFLHHHHMPVAYYKEEIWKKVDDVQEWSGAMPCKKKNGTIYWVFVHISPVVENGEVAGFSEVHRSATPLEIEEAQEEYAKFM